MDIGDRISIQSQTRQALSGSAAAQVQAASSPEQSRARAAAEEFEAVFLSQMLEPMFKGIETDGMFGGGSSEKIYQSVMLQEYGKALARSGGVGIADAVEREILRLQEVQQP